MKLSGVCAYLNRSSKSGFDSLLLSQCSFYQIAEKQSVSVLLYDNLHDI